MVSVPAPPQCQPTGPAVPERGPALLIPAFQAARSLPVLLGEIARGLPGLPVLVVDDGSTDDTTQAARAGGAEVFRHLRNQGKGAALARGWSLLFRRGHAAVLCLDADGQHDPAEAKAFLDLWRRERPDLIVGDRGLGEASMPWDRRLSNRLSTLVLRRRTGLPLTDSQCGFRLLTRSLWEGLRLRGRAYDQESELLLQAAALGARVRQVPVVQRPARADSHVRRGPDLLRFLARLAEGAAALEDEET
jgi:glycosyltransferase involved in cell wall biosynthesis